MNRKDRQERKDHLKPRIRDLSTASLVVVVSLTGSRGFIGGLPPHLNNEAICPRDSPIRATTRLPRDQMRLLTRKNLCDGLSGLCVLSGSRIGQSGSTYHESVTPCRPLFSPSTRMNRRDFSNGAGRNVGPSRTSFLLARICALTGSEFPSAMVIFTLIQTGRNSDL